MQVAAAWSRGLEIAGARKRKRGPVRRAEVGRSSQEPRNVLGDYVEYLAGGVAPGDALGIGREARQVAVPSGRELAALHLIYLGGEIGELAAVVGKERLPPRARGRPARADAGIELFAHPVGNEKLRVFRPAIGALGQTYLFVAQRIAVRRRRVDLVRRAVADMAVQDDQRRPAVGSVEDLERVLNSVGIVGIADAQHVPPIGHETRRHVFGEGDAGAALNAYPVVVVDPAEVVEAEMAGKRSGLRTDPFHEAAVATDRVDVVIENLEAGPVVAAGQPFSRDRHADAGGDSLS